MNNMRRKTAIIFSTQKRRKSLQDGHGKKTREPRKFDGEGDSRAFPVKGTA